MQKKEEIVYLINNEIYLHLKEAKNEIGIEYKAYRVKDGTLVYSGLITYKSMLGALIDNPLRYARDEVMQEVCLKRIYVAEVALHTLDDLKDAKRAYRKAHRNDPHAHSIRFITSDYDHLFRIPDGGVVEIQFPDRSIAVKCEYKDEYHTKIGDKVFNICEFAKHVEKQGGSVRPEPEVFKENAAWKLERVGYLLVQRVDTGFDYTIYDEGYQLIDGGQIDDSTLSMNEVREQILDSYGYAKCQRTTLPYEDVEEQIEAEE